MDASRLLAAQVRGIGAIVRDLSVKIDAPTSRARAFPGSNPIGFTLWHGARTLDWAINTMVRGVDEVAFSFDFEGPADARVSEIGFGLNLSEAGAVAEATTPAQVADYLDRVVAEAISWLKTEPDLSPYPTWPRTSPGSPDTARPSMSRRWARMQ